MPNCSSCPLNREHAKGDLPDSAKKELCDKLFSVINNLAEMTVDMVVNMLHGSEHHVWYNRRLLGESQKRDTHEQLHSGYARIEDFLDYSDMPDLVTLHEVEEERIVVD